MCVTHKMISQKMEKEQNIIDFFITWKIYLQLN